VFNPLGVPSRMNVGQISTHLAGLAPVLGSRSAAVDAYNSKRDLRPLKDI
jgi:DNA-directed RNA polymerase beta subunit